MTLDDIFAEIGFPEPPLVTPPPQRSHPTYSVGPCGKIIYPSRTVARSAIVNRLNKGTGGATHLLAYECRTCKGWHISSRPGGRVWQ